jgi:hypothetical protein
MLLNTDQRYEIGMRGEAFTVESPRTTFEAKLTGVRGVPGDRQPPVQVSIPAKARELIFDDPVEPIYDGDLT